MARVLLVGGGCRGLSLARGLTGAGHAVRVTTRTERGRAAIEAEGGECVIATPQAMGTLRGALDAVTIACWLLATASGDAGEVAALHTERLEQWLTRVIDSTVRGVVYEAGCSGASVEGARLARALCMTHAIPLTVVEADPLDAQAWMLAARGAVAELLAG